MYIYIYIYTYVYVRHHITICYTMIQYNILYCNTGHDVDALGVLAQLNCAGLQVSVPHTGGRSRGGCSQGVVFEPILLFTGADFGLVLL